jgi:hypothetical protein
VVEVLWAPGAKVAEATKAANMVTDTRAGVVEVAELARTVVLALVKAVARAAATVGAIEATASSVQVQEAAAMADLGCSPQSDRTTAQRG